MSKLSMGTRGRRRHTGSCYATPRLPSLDVPKQQKKRQHTCLQSGQNYLRVGTNST
uniref:Uncharacterized protein n=1 Tax=Anguilla anguilla TaxID=7936 RepID=A0A0E9W4A2_ANGAN